MKKLFLLLTLGVVFTHVGFTLGMQIPKTIDKKILIFIDETSYACGVDPLLVCAMISEESDWKIKAVSKNLNGTTDHGLMQLNSDFIPEFIWRYGKPGKKYDPVNNVYDNLELGIKHLSKMIAAWDGDIIKGLYSYNCGLARTRTGRIPIMTKDYVNRVLTLYLPLSTAWRLTYYKEKKE